MSKRRLSKNAKTDIGKDRIDKLLSMSMEAVREGKGDRAIRYVTLARRISMKTRVKLPKSFRFCSECFMPQMPGVNCTVRLNGHKLVSRCEKCGTIWRMPYIKELRRDD